MFCISFLAIKIQENHGRQEPITELDKYCNAELHHSWHRKHLRVQLPLDRLNAELQLSALQLNVYGKTALELASEPTAARKPCTVHIPNANSLKLS